jgi:K+-transporting ATPase ATPase C chain
MATFLTSVRVAIVSMIICVAGYAALVLGFAQVITPATANGSLLTDGKGTVIGSELIAQNFSEPRYFWPRPSAVDYNADGAGGSNKSPTSPDLTARAAETVAHYGATGTDRLPADLAAASGAGLDPHISLAGALYQVPRVAAARDLPQAEIKGLVERSAFSPGGPLTSTRIVNVLLLNRQLDAIGRPAGG